MSVCRSLASIPVVLLACALGSAGLGGCYDLSTSGPRPEDFANSPAASEPEVQAQPVAHGSPTDLDRSQALVKALATGSTPPSAEANAARLPVERASEPTP